MYFQNKKSQRTFELALIAVVVGLACLLHRVDVHKMIILHLFYLPVGLATFFLGRYRTGVLTLFCILAVTAVMFFDIDNGTAAGSPLTTALALTLWAAVMGLNVLLLGTLSDERSTKINELHDAYVGVVEVLSRYLGNANPQTKSRSERVTNLSQRVALQMRLSAAEVDDVRVAALLQDMEHLEVTARVLRKAVGDLEHDSPALDNEHTFRGSDLVQSLGSVLTRALPLLSRQGEPLAVEEAQSMRHAGRETPFGAYIIEAVRAYDQLVNPIDGVVALSSADALEELRQGYDQEFHPAVLHALEQVASGLGDDETLAEQVPVGAI
ncbi:MAG: hypothetical protein DWQ31_06270 [Planctomycetota bacterium]|nr:MAG: hypothetical protein DWQ31_06270 [Planctomycetota bacterium]REJ98612.1 MAG: hypothetical protein DWQ35_01025 [Planctomycetota bacterium]REK29912.1 MAG: hypothetical protein DWQ42_03145 [Planctomycetota bacterium]REK47918.1 MAG: hypothetical protein DWQ46_03215 [Planctomycetota bacterium]